MSVFSFYTLIAGFCLGILSFSFWSLSGWLAGLSLLIGVGVSMVWSKNRTEIFAPCVISLAIFFVAFSAGVWRTAYDHNSTLNPELLEQVGEEYSFVGVVSREPDKRDSSQHLYIKVGNETILVVTDRYGVFNYGDEVSVTGELSRPQPFETDLGRTFNYEGYLKAQGVNFWLVYPEVIILSGGHGHSVLAGLLNFKQKFMHQIESVINEPAVGLGEGLLLGVKQALGDDLEQVFRATGIIHIVVLSGYNISLVVLFVMYVLSYLLPFRFRLGFGLTAVAAFALLVGLSATVLRASIMAGLLLLAQHTGRVYTIMRALMLAGLLMLMINPYLLPYDVGFQLSFLATLGLILLAPHLERLVAFMPTVFKMREFLVATVATQIFVMPLLLWQIGEFSVVSVIVNLLVLPMVPVAMLLTFLTGLVSFVSATLAWPFAFLSQLSLDYILLVAIRFAELPFAVYVVPPFPFWVVVFAYAVLGYGLWRYLNHSQKTIMADNVSNLEDWTIEDWDDLVERVKNSKAGEEASASSPATPIFFK